ncbi:MAG: 50S ribosomal protein L18 [Clostridiaceae bacterium]|jgi:large subunit ribosomal protein L18|nr:50S ribosomal protein L18 [Clostridiaceae bacterium]
MIAKQDKNIVRRKRQQRVRNKISGTAARPRLNVYRSNSHIYVQLIDDVKGVTLVSASTLEKDIIAAIADKTKSEAAKIVGAAAAKKALEAGITAVVFDRAGYIYTGRVAAVATGAREAGLQF